MQIRLFTSGTHNGLNFNNEDIAKIAARTTAEAPERIPIVLGHPRNDLPVLGYLPKAMIRTYQEGDKVSLGFDREGAELDEESLSAIRSLGRNKISIRLEEGKIKHIGLVKKAAVAENNTQDFADLTGNFAAPDDFCDNDDSGFWERFKQIFQTSKTTDFMSVNEEEEKKRNADFTALQAEVKGIGQTVSNLEKILTGQEDEKKRTALTADFGAAEFSHLTDAERLTAVSLCAKMTPEEISSYKNLLKAGNHKPQKPGNGSVTANFGKDGKEDREAEDLIREQVESVI